MVFHVDEIAAAVKQLQTLHVEPSGVSTEKGVPVRILLRDPENNEIEIRVNRP